MSCADVAKLCVYVFALAHHLIICDCQKEFGSVSSTPDSTPPCTDGGNEDSDFPELQTAREWSEDEEVPEDDDDGCLSSPSTWGTPRQNSFELTFSYIAFSESECPSRRDSGQCRTGSRERMSLLHHTDTTETLMTLDPLTVELNPHASTEEEEVDQSTGSLPEPTENRPEILESFSQSIEDLTEKDTGKMEEGKEMPNNQTHSETDNMQVMDLIYWKDTERTGIVFTGLVVGLISLFQLSIITVLSTLSLAVMCFTISVRIYCKLLNALQLRDSEHPFKSYMEMDISLHGQQTEHCMQRIIVLTCSALDKLKNLVFVGSLFDSLKFLLLMYLVTYLGALCNGLTLLIIGVIAAFSFPQFYRQNQGKVDNLFASVQAHIDNLKDFLNRLAQGGGPISDPTPGGAKPRSQ